MCSGGRFPRGQRLRTKTLCDDNCGRLVGRVRSHSAKWLARQLLVFFALDTYLTDSLPTVTLSIAHAVAQVGCWAVSLEAPRNSTRAGWRQIDSFHGTFSRLFGPQFGKSSNRLAQDPLGSGCCRAESRSCGAEFACARYRASLRGVAECANLRVVVPRPKNVRARAARHVFQGRCVL